MEQSFSEIIELLKKINGIDISCFDDSFIAQSIEKRFSANGMHSPDDYLVYLKNNGPEAGLLLDSMHISFSEFFRNPLTFAYLEQLVLPMLLAKKKKDKGKELRIWSAACASGQEAYSLAILLDEIRENFSEKMEYRIFATDNNLLELGKARKGSYSSFIVNKVTLKRLNTYFIRDNENYLLQPFLKKYVDFSFFDLLSDQRTCPEPSIYGDFDLVVCSNLLFYYKPEYRKRILEKIGQTMAPGAYLITGETEREILTKYNYQEVFENSAIFQKKILSPLR